MRDRAAFRRARATTHRKKSSTIESRLGARPGTEFQGKNCSSRTTTSGSAGPSMHAVVRVCRPSMVLQRCSAPGSGHAAPSALAPQGQGGPACVPTKLSTLSPRSLAVSALSEPLAAMSAAATSTTHGAQHRPAGRKSCLMFVPLCSQRQRLGFNGQRNSSAEALRAHVQASRLARPLVQLSCAPPGTLIARHRLGAPYRSCAGSAAMSRTVLGTAHAGSSSPRRIDEGAVSSAWPARVWPTAPTRFSDAQR